MVFSLIGFSGCLKSEDYVDHCLESEQTIQKSSLYNSTFSSLTVGSYNAYYKSYRVNTSEISPAEGNQVYVKFVGKLLSGTVFENTYKDSAYVFPLNPTSNSAVIIGLNESVRVMHRGDSVISIVPSCMAFNNNQAYGGLVPAYSPVVFDNLVLTKILTEGERIDDYIKIKKFNPDSVTKMVSGLRIISKSPGSGDTPKDGQTVTVSYKGYMINGDIYFDPVKTATNQNPSPNSYSFVVGNQSGVIDGWKEAIKTIKPGGTAIWIMPSSLGYGSTGTVGSNAQITIPGYSPIAFEVKLVSVK